MFISTVKKKYILSIAKQVFFKDLVFMTKNMFPELKLKFPKPPTYVWNPKDEEEQIDVQKIKDSLKIKFPNLVWTSRYDGVPVADYSFPDGTWAEFAIGKEANHLTLTSFTEKTKLGDA